jgi:predicted DNA-binding transcriptional regulator YafY
MLKVTFYTYAFQDWEACMRADRLLILLLLLQTNGRVTAQTLAKRLEVSERTIYRDLEALSLAGVPVYAERGPGGGWKLLEDYRTNLTRLTETEVNTLFMSGIAGPIADLGLGKAGEDALLKLLAALPTVYRRNAERARQRIHLDAAGWFHREEEVPYLQVVQEAVWNDRRLRLTYQRGDLDLVERFVDPYGLVAKASIWYLVAASSGEMRVYRVSRIQAVEMTEEGFDRPADFVLRAFWAQWSAEFEMSLWRYPVTLRVAPDAVPILTHVLGDWVQALVKQADPPDTEGWITLSLLFEGLPEARSRLLGLGTMIEVLEPQELRDSLAEFAARIANFYIR